MSTIRREVLTKLQRIITRLRRIGPSQFLTADDYYPCPYTSGYLQACKDMSNALKRMEKVKR